MTAASPTFARRSRLAPLVETWSGVANALEKSAGAALDLAVRLWLAKVFFISGALKTVNWDVTVFLYANEHPVPGLSPETAAFIGTAIELICPILLACGFATRLAALPLLLTAAFLQLTYKNLTDHLYWMSLLGLLISRGAGALSIDALVAPHLAGSAVPFGAALRRVARFKERFLLPAIELVVRVWLAWLWWRFAFATGAGALPAAGGALCALLALGLATRGAALALAVLSSTLFPNEIALGDPTLRVLLLANFVLFGAGPLSLDAAIARQARRLCPSLGDDASWLDGAPRVVIVGAGFGGVSAALTLRHAWARVTLIDSRNHFLFQPLLYQVATATLSPADIATPIRALLRDHPNCRVLMGEAHAIDRDKRDILVGDARIPFDYLVLATGARHSYFGKDAWEAFAPGLKTIDDATALRSRVLAAFEKAEACADEAERRRLMTFVLVGGGPTGVELAGAIAELARQGLRAEFRTIDPATARVILVQSGPLILPSFPKELSIAAAQSLAALGVEVLTHARVNDIDADGVKIGDQRVEARTVLWTAGVMASPAGEWLGAERDRAGRIAVGPDLAVAGVNNVFALGDVSACKGADGKLLPGLAAVAKQQGVHVAKLIRARIEGGRDPGPFRYVDYGSLATIGRKAAVADLRFLKLSGATAWWLWGFVHVAFLIDARSRIAVMFDWFWSYLTYRRSVRLITGKQRAAG